MKKDAQSLCAIIKPALSFLSPEVAAAIEELQARAFAYERLQEFLKIAVSSPLETADSANSALAALLSPISITAFVRKHPRKSYQAKARSNYTGSLEWSPQTRSGSLGSLLADVMVMTGRGNPDLYRAVGSDLGSDKRFEETCKPEDVWLLLDLDQIYHQVVEAWPSGGAVRPDKKRIVQSALERMVLAAIKHQ